jgi:hypothetical protein
LYVKGLHILQPSPDIMTELIPVEVDVGGACAAHGKEDIYRREENGTWKT